MYQKSQGFHRLGIVFGTIVSLCWVIYVANASYGFTHLHAQGLSLFLFLLPVFFLFGYGLSMCIYWVKRGFQNDQEHH